MKQWILLRAQNFIPFLSRFYVNFGSEKYVDNAMSFGKVPRCFSKVMSF